MASHISNIYTFTVYVYIIIYYILDTTLPVNWQKNTKRYFPVLVTLSSKVSTDQFFQPQKIKAGETGQTRKWFRGMFAQWQGHSIPNKGIKKKKTFNTSPAQTQKTSENPEKKRLWYESA